MWTEKGNEKDLVKIIVFLLRSILRALRLDATPLGAREKQQELSSKISDLGSSSLGVKEPGGHRILAQTTKAAEAADWHRVALC